VVEEDDLFRRSVKSEARLRCRPGGGFYKGTFCWHAASKVVSGGENGMVGIVAERVQGGDAELLPSLRAGRPAAFAALMRQNNQRLFRLARGILRDDAEAEDAVQEGYVRAFTRLDGFKGEASLATWLARIVANEALGRLRRRRPTVDIDDVAETMIVGEGAAGLGAAEPTPEQASARHEIRRVIEAAVDQLPVAFRSVFMLRAIEQMSIDETAACLGIPGETVKTRFHRANKLLRQALTRQFGAIFDGAFPFLGSRCDRLVMRVLERLGLSAETSLAAPQGDRPVPSRCPP
jgi:RNA polymerase sigma-70 factor (ECF subfamily)